jgi:hypothetical protein
LGEDEYPIFLQKWVYVLRSSTCDRLLKKVVISGAVLTLAAAAAHMLHPAAETAYRAAAIQPGQRMADQHPHLVFGRLSDQHRKAEVSA